ncbi:gamma-mobile-trio protein GmtX [Massilia pseudoviolaceinigra]|uniref:gamma-mobile-trio protein GmtX n=1 Tax=Massilia pseudoviolaceinigra TaxID=3057165 RepID=UPI0027967071|nr:gamma-mobile-trio protein GmtX [Massilia sp. CCM 9206]MDQ1921244.1 gamma-mobile-trio protein GmtX [Massilia sp. CCM 9206]
MVTLLKSETDRVLDMRSQPKAEPLDLIQILPASTQLLPSEIEALRHAVSNKFFSEQDWKCDENGRITDHMGRQLYKVGYTTSILKLLGKSNARFGA